jgi:tetratricopeptide (TPR) repeat protein
MSVAQATLDMGAEWVVATWWLAGTLAASPASPAAQASEKAEQQAPSEEEVERLRREANEKLLRGEFDRARREFEAILKMVPEDAPAQRDAARAAAAASQFEEAAAALERAHHFEHHTPDPELHYLRGEALYALDRSAEAQREHRIAELEIGKDPKERMPKLWLARIYARRGYVVLAHRIYESMLPQPPKFDTEVALNQADAHMMNKDWTGGAAVLRRYLALDPKNVRGREMLAWALEASGDIVGELAVRRELAAEMPTRAYRRDYGRALERATSFRAARDEYDGAIHVAGPAADAALVTSYQQMRYRASPELGGGLQFRSDPQAWSWRLQTGGALPFKARHQFAAVAWHERSTDWSANQVVGSNTLLLDGSVTGVGLQSLFAHRSGASLFVGADGRFGTTRGVDAQGNQLYGPSNRFTGGATAELDTGGFFQNAQANLVALFNEQWNDAPVIVHEGGTMSGPTGRLHLFPTSRIVLASTGFQVRRLGLDAQGTAAAPHGWQYMVWGGIDFNLWADPKRVVRGEALDERMVRRTYLADSGVLAYRHFEVWNELGPDFRISLAPRGSVDNGTLAIRKVFGAAGRAGLDLRGGGGYDNQRRRVIWQVGGSFVLAATWSTRLSVSYDRVHETFTGLPGTLQIGWVTFHADL